MDCCDRIIKDFTYVSKESLSKLNLVPKFRAGMLLLCGDTLKFQLSTTINIDVLLSYISINTLTSPDYVARFQSSVNNIVYSFPSCSWII